VASKEGANGKGLDFVGARGKNSLSKGLNEYRSFSARRIVSNVFWIRNR